MQVHPIRSREDIERMERLLRYYSYRDWFAFKLGINSALRAGDLLQLKVKHVRPRYLMLKESKTRKIREIYINDFMRSLIDDYIKYMDDEDYLFRSPHENKTITVENFYQRMRFCGRMIGLDRVGTHTCRKTFAYHYYRETGDISQLMEILNHSSERMTLIYICVIQEEIDRNMKTFYL